MFKGEIYIKTNYLLDLFNSKKFLEMDKLKQFEIISDFLKDFGDSQKTLGRNQILLHFQNEIKDLKR